MKLLTRSLIINKEMINNPKLYLNSENNSKNIKNKNDNINNNNLRKNANNQINKNIFYD